MKAAMQITSNNLWIPTQRETARVGLAALPMPAALEFTTDYEQEVIASSRAYHDHHFDCKQCIAAGRGRVYAQRCEVGARLFTIYTKGPLAVDALESDAEGAARGGSSVAAAPKAQKLPPVGNTGGSFRSGQHV